MKTYLKYLAVLVLLLFPVIGTSQGSGPYPVSFVELIANPDKFDGRLVAVTGFLGIDPPDGNMLYLHKEDYDHGIVLNAVEIQLTKEAWVEREKLDLNYVQVVGVFRSREKSHSLYSAITDLRTCSLWSQVSNPIRQRLSGSRKHNPK